MIAASAGSRYKVQFLEYRFAFLVFPFLSLFKPTTFVSSAGHRF
jgi:hypothetical protein